MINIYFIVCTKYVIIRSYYVVIDTDLIVCMEYTRILYMRWPPPPPLPPYTLNVILNTIIERIIIRI